MGVSGSNETVDAEDGGAARRRAAFAQAKLGLWEYDELGSRFVGSEVVHEIFGWTEATVPSLEAVSRLYVSEPGGTLEQAITLALESGKPFSLISEIQTQAGKRKWVRTQGQPSDEPGSGGRKLFGTVQDISEIRLLDRITQESEMTLAQVERITHIGHFSVSLTDGSIYHSDEIKRIFGYEPSEYALSVEEAIDAYHPDDRDEVTRLFNRAVETGEGYEFDLRVVQPSGDIRHVRSRGYTEQDEHGKVTRVYGVFHDVTDQMLAERAIRESAASMKTLVDAIHTAIVVHGKSGEVLLSNQMANRLLAPLAPDVVGKSLTDPAWRFVFEDGRDVPVQDLPATKILRTKEPIEGLVLGRHDGESIAWMLVNGVPILGDDGTLSSVIISFVDITERKEMEERLQQSEKMRAVGQLAGGVAHDFNNQLMVIMSFAELLKESLKENSDASSLVDGIVSGAARSAELTRQLLAFARKGNYVAATVDFNELTSEVASIARHSFDKKIRITHHPSPGPATIDGDASQLQNALLNMALNSRDAMPQGGELSFTTARVTLDARAMKDRNLDAEAGECVRVTIRDDGVGMDASVLKQVFEPFFTTKGPGMGAGMGMASVYGTVKNHRGAIEVESEPGGGTTITMYFPLVLGRGRNSESPPAKTRGVGGRILIIDDEEGVAKSMSMLLRSKGYQTTTCAHGREGVAEFQKSWRTTDLVFLDMIMPNMNGAETFRALRAIDPEVKIVLISGFSYTEEARRVREEGAAAFLVKPVPAKELLQTIADVLGHERPS